VAGTIRMGYQYRPPFEDQCVLVNLTGLN